MSQITLDFETTFMNLSYKDPKDDELVYSRHTKEWESRRRIDQDTYYCLRSTISLGRSYEDSDII